WQEREAASPPPDLISMMIHSEATRSMTPHEYLGNLLLLIVGGNDTTRNSMSALPIVGRLWPEEWDKIAADAALIPSAAQELIRWQTPLAHMRRTVQPGEPERVASCFVHGYRTLPARLVRC